MIVGGLLSFLGILFQVTKVTNARFRFDNEHKTTYV